MAHSFRKFAHNVNATTKFHNGNGLGLALSRRYMKREHFLCIPISPETV
jgi:hypothetical protein